MTSQPQMAKQYFSSSMINNVFNLCRNRWAEKGRTSPPHAVALGVGGRAGDGMRKMFQKLSAEGLSLRLQALGMHSRDGAAHFLAEGCVGRWAVQGSAGDTE